MSPKKIFIFLIINFGIFSCFFICPKTIEFVNAQLISFNVNSQYDLFKRSEIVAISKETSKYAYFFVDNQWWGNLTDLEKERALNSISNLAKEFDNVIYPKLTEFLGSIWSPGIDNDDKITILFLPLIGEAGGYINYSDEYPKNKVSKSNEREMLYLNTSHLNSPLIKSFLAHEFQHLITFYQKDKLQKVSEDVWLNEARSEYAPTYLGYEDVFLGSNLEKRVKNFLKNPSDPLCEFKNEPADYGAVNLFLRYFADYYGKDTISEMMKDEKAGIESINNALKKRGYNISFSQVFTNWTIANFLNNCSTGQPFCYLNPNLNYNNLHIVLGEALNVPGFTQDIIIKDWQPLYYKFEPGGIFDKKRLKIYFEKENLEDLFRVPYIVHETDGGILVDFMEILNNKATVYVSDFGSKIDSVTVISSKQSKFDNFSENDISAPFKLSATLVDEAPTYSDGSLLRAIGDSKVYLIENGKKHWIPNPSVFDIYNLNWGNVKEVDSTDLEKFPRAKLLRVRGDDKVYYLTEGGLIRHLPSAEVFLSYGNKWEDIIEISREELNVYPLNNLVYLGGDYKIYKLDDGRKHWIQNAKAFNRLKYDWSKIAPVNFAELNAYSEGPPIF